MNTLPEHIAELIQQGRKIEAIKLIREETGVGLAEAKAAVERLQRGDDLGEPPSVPSGDVPADVRTLAYEGRTIEAIKLLREEAGLGLKEAKLLVAQLPVDPQVQAARPQGAAVLVAAVVALLIGLGALIALVFQS